MFQFLTKVYKNVAFKAVIQSNLQVCRMSLLKISMASNRGMCVCLKKFTISTRFVATVAAAAVCFRS